RSRRPEHPDPPQLHRAGTGGGRMSTATDFEKLAASVRAAQRRYGSVRGDKRSAVLRRLARVLEEQEESLLEANRQDLVAANESGLTGTLLKRLALTPEKLATLREGVLQLATQEDPLGRVLRRTELDEGLMLTQVASPLGVLLIIFESRPDAVIQIGSLALRTGNGVILKGGSEALHSNRALVGCLRQALAGENLPEDVVVGIEGRQAVQELLALDHHIDLVIPRGSGELVRSIQSSTRIPVLGHAEGICHLYLDASADPEMAAQLAVDGKCSYPSACNATETLLVHEAFLPHLGAVEEALTAAGVRIKADERSRPHLPASAPAQESDWGTEWGDLVLGVKTVDSLEEAVEHIHRHGSAHTDAIVTEDRLAAERFLESVDSASVFVNAS
ncbi:MAG: glutamate-5-semialdehyde dehydrogenase, partial [Acidobacteria bacterium]|nr:glutamate-5-semialdehyde dehydrogenase [Acidobacteriota bacterium]